MPQGEYLYYIGEVVTLKGMVDHISWGKPHPLMAVHIYVKSYGSVPEAKNYYLVCGIKIEGGRQYAETVMYEFPEDVLVIYPALQE